MKKFLEKYHNPYVWIGIQTAMVLLVVIGYATGIYGLKFALFFGIINILFTGMDLMQIEEKKDEIN